MSKKPALGRGLSALLQNTETDVTSNSIGDNQNMVGAVTTIPVSSIDANPFQPRSTFEKEALQELADSIEEHGIIQPVTVRKLGYGKYQLISGERRHRASQIVGLKEIPAFIRVANDQEMLEMALVENIQRRDLDSIEIAFSYQKLIEECNLTQEQLSEKVSKKRSTISNYLRLLKLPAEIQLAIRTRELSMGHARTLINLEDKRQQVAIYKKIIEEGLSVRQAESLVRGEKNKEEIIESKKETTSPSLSFSEQKIKDDLSSMFSTSVQLQKNDKGKGKITISFNSDNDLDRIIEVLGL